MNQALKAGLAVFLNFSLLVNQLSAELQQITFDSVEWIPWQPVGVNGASEWWLNSGNAVVSPDGEGFGGGKALHIPVNSQEETRLARTITWNPSENTAFIDLRVKPAADPAGSLASIHVNGTQLAFQVPQGSSIGEIWVYQGNDGAANPQADPEEWIKTAGTFSIPAGGTSANNYSRITFRHDYARNLWDLFIDGKLAAANLSFEQRGASLQSIDFYGSMIGDTHVDDLSALTTNMLFPDADKDGLSDAWEIANGSNPNLYDRDAIKPGQGRSFLDLYMDSLWPSGGANGTGTLPSSGGIPPLTINTEAPHQAVGALKGSLAVGGDGSANYSVPIDIPKGTAGMEPKISLAYSSGAGNGMMGVGWNLTGLQRITRGPSSAAKDGTYDPMDFDSSDRFFLDGERLVCVAGAYGAAGSEYRTEIDSYARITAIGTGPASWKIETKAGLVVTMGATADSKTSVTAGTLSWGVNRVQDTVGNYYSVDYTRESTSGQPFDFIDHRVSAIHYTGNGTMQPYCHVYFDYETRPDTSFAYTTHAGYQATMRLSKIRVMTDGFVNHSYRLGYTVSYQTGRSMLASIAKYAGDNTSLMTPPTTFTYDGIQSGEPIWRDPGDVSLPVYGVNMDANGAGINSFVSTSSADDTLVELTGDVSRYFPLPSGNITVYPDTCIKFDFKSDRQDRGAIIGLDGDADYSSRSIQKLCRIGGTGSLVLNGSGQTYSGTTEPYTVGQGWMTYDLSIGSSNSPVMSNLVLMCVDTQANDGTDNASFRNIRIYRSGTQQPADVEPIRFPQTTNLPVMFDSNGKDMGVISMDLDSDGLPDLSDWRVTKYNYNSNNESLTYTSFTPTTTGGVYRNTGGGFVADSSLIPPASVPLGCRAADSDAYGHSSKHQLLGKPMDVNGDGKLDLMASVRIERLTARSYSALRNEYEFLTWNGASWVNLAGWELPFRLDSTYSDASNSPQRVHHFQWLDLNSDGYQDLVIHTNDRGRLFNSAAEQLKLGGGAQQQIARNNASIAYLNKGRNGPGWIRDDSYGLPEPLTQNQDNLGRRLADLEGDGVMEMTEATGNTTSPAQVSHIYRMNSAGSNRWNSTPGMANPPADPHDFPLSFKALNNSDPGILLMDMNGDSLPDILQARKEFGGLYQSFHLNTGKRTSPCWSLSPTYQLTGYPLSYRDDGYGFSHGFEVGDLNGDGLPDILYSDIDNTATPGPDNLAFLNTGTGWSQRTEWGAPGTKRIYTSSNNRTNGQRSARLQDINGDGFPDLLTSLLGKTPVVWYNNCRPEVLKSVTDGFGSQLQVDYLRLNDPTPTDGFGTRVYQKWTDSMPAGQNAVVDARLVVSSYSEPDGNGGLRVRSQRYGDLRYDRYNESSLGFGWTEAKDHLNNQTTRTETHREYPFGGSPLWTRTWVEVKPGDLLLALVGVTAGTKCLSEETATYAEMPTQTGTEGVVIRRPVQTFSQKSLCDLTGNLISRTKTTQNLANFDAYGFVTHSTVESLDGSKVTSSNAYTHTVDANRWHLGRLSQSTVTKEGASPTITKTSSFTYVPANGLLKTETIEPGHALSVTKTYTHDAFGNVTAASVTGSGLTRSSSSIYDPQGRFVLEESNQLGHTISYDYDTQRALLLSTTSITGKTTAFGYDAYGTLIHTWHPDATQTGESTGYADGSQLPASVSALVINPIHYFRAKQTSGSPVGKVYLDAFGREIVAESTILRDASASGSGHYSKIYTVSQYDLLGRKTLVSEPFGAGDIPLVTQIHYDLLSRVVETIHPDGQSDSVMEFSTVAHATNPLTYSKVQNARNGVLERWEDQHGRMIQSRDPSSQITAFQHDHEGRILSVAMNGANLLTNTFDLFGNKTQVTEANSGTSSSIHNAFGEVTSSTNAKGQVTGFAYDVLGRATTVTKPEGTYTTSYDGARGSGLGKPWKTTGPDGYQETISYDNLGRPRSTVTTRFGETFNTSTSYDALGRPLTETDAGGLAVVHEYDPNYSFPTALRIGPGSEGAGTLLWQAGTFDSKGRAITQTLAQDVSASASYHPASGLLATMNASQGGTSLQNKTYDWDPMGNLIFRADAIAGKREFFKHDDLNRVTHAYVGSIAETTHSFDGVPNNFNYAANGNLLSKPGLSNVAYGCPRPHAVTSATVKGASRSYTYDAAGYVTADGKRTYTWTSFGQLSSLDYLSAPALQTFAGITVYQASRVQSNFEFDAGGNRAKQLKQRIALDDSRQLEETLYLGSYEREIHMTKATASASPVVTKTVHRHSLGGFASYTKTVGTTGSVVRLSTILKDHLGSTDVILTGLWNGSAFANHQTERQSFDAWGERRAADTFLTYRATDSDPFRTSARDYDRGYTGHEQLDDSGLIHMNGRIYDPELGRMLSPDPFVQVPEYSQNFNRYSYVMNNPLNLTDPTGFSWLSKAFHKIGSWIKENWRTVVSIVFAAVLFVVIGPGSFMSMFQGSMFTSGWAVGASIGGLSGAFNAAINGGSFGDVLRAGVIGAIQGGISGGMLHNMETAAELSGQWYDKAAHIVGHGVVGGAVNEAMGGKFQDGFLAAAAGAAAGWSGIYKATAGTGALGRTAIAGVIGGTASALGGGKFANGAYTAAFQHLLNNELVEKLSKADTDHRWNDLRKSIDASDPTDQFTLGEGHMQTILARGHFRTISMGFEKMSYREFVRTLMGYDGDMMEYANRFFVYGGRRFSGSDINYSLQGMAWERYSRGISPLSEIQKIGFNVVNNLGQLVYKPFAGGYSWSGVQKDLAQMTYTSHKFTTCGRKL